MVDGRDDVEDGQALDAPRVVERHSVRDPRAAVVANDGEAFESERPHELDQLTGDLTLAEPLAARPPGFGMTPAVAPQVRGHDRMPPLRERRDQIPPAVVRLREAVQQEHRLAAPGGRNEIVGASNPVAHVAHVLDRTGDHGSCVMSPLRR